MKNYLVVTLLLSGVIQAGETTMFDAWIDYQVQDDMYNATLVFNSEIEERYAYQLVAQREDENGNKSNTKQSGFIDAKMQQEQLVNNFSFNVNPQTKITIHLSIYDSQSNLLLEKDYQYPPK